MRNVPFSLLLLLLILLGAAACQRGGAKPEESAPPRERPPAVSEQGAPEALPHMSVTLYFPSTSEDGLVGETREILVTSSPGDLAKQILSDLLGGPTEASASFSFVPPGTRLKQVYVLKGGVVYADFSEELRSGIEGGSEAEVLTVYSIVNSLALNIPEISRVGILVEGRTCDTLNGHLDLRRPLPPNRKLVTQEAEKPGEAV